MVKGYAERKSKAEIMLKRFVITLHKYSRGKSKFCFFVSMEERKQDHNSLTAAIDSFLILTV